MSLMARPRKRHVQLPLPRARTHGGKRPGAGRPPNGEEAGAPHDRRPRLGKSQPVHVTLRVARDVGQLRVREIYRAVRAATLAIAWRDDFRIVHLSIQHDHLHLLVEADDERALSNGVRGFAISAARHINRAVSCRRTQPRHGRVFPDRYHETILTSPRQVRNALRYVMTNWKKHREDRRWHARNWLLDPFSSAISFTGWKELEDRAWTWELPATYEPLRVASPRTWLLSRGWQRAGGISLHDRPA